MYGIMTQLVFTLHVNSISIVQQSGHRSHSTVCHEIILLFMGQEKVIQINSCDLSRSNWIKLLSHENSHKELMRLVTATTTLIQMLLLIRMDVHSQGFPPGVVYHLPC